MDLFYKRECSEDVFPSGRKTTDRFLKNEAFEICRNRFRYFTSEGLAKALVSVVKPEEEILLFRSSIGSPILTELPMKAGLQVQDIPIYDLEVIEEEKMSLSDLDYLTFSSASGVRAFFESYGSLPEKIRCVCIGDVTAKEFQKYSEKSELMAKEISVEGIWKTMEEYIKSNF